MLKRLDKNNFESEIKTGLKLVEFFAPWCDYCQQQAPVLKEMDKIWIGQVNSDLSSDLIEKYRINSYPSFILFKDGKEIDRFSGLHSKFDIMNIILKYI